MFGRCSTATIANVDQAFDAAEVKAREFGKEAAGQITEAYRAGNIDRNGVSAWVEVALEQTALNAAGVPKAMLRQILATLHRTIRSDLAAVGIEIAELPT